MSTKKKNDRKSSKGISGPFSGVVGCVGSLPRQFPLFNFLCLLVSSVSNFHLDTGRAVVDTLGSLFSRPVGREGWCKQILLACACSVSSTLGLPRSWCTPLRLYVAPPGNRLRPALGFRHLPGLSRSGSALRKPSEAQIWLGLRFVPFPGLSSSGV